MRPLFPLLIACVLLAQTPPPETVQPFGSKFPNLDSLAVGAWWQKKAPAKGKKGAGNPPPTMIVPRDQVIAFALYTQQDGMLKLTAQLYPLMLDETREVRLEVRKGDEWMEVSRAQVMFPGWSAHFRVGGWDGSKDTPYRVRHGEKAVFEGVIRRDPIDKDLITVANMSCNSSRTTGARPEIIDNLRRQDPDLLFFAGDQTYRHTEHTAGWIEFGLQFRDVMRDRPTICIPDDHDVGHPNLWGEDGKESTAPGNADGGYMFPVAYVNMVQRQQTWHLPDAFNPTPVQRGIGVYYTRLKVGGMDFAILEDRKFKSGPLGKIPQQGPRPDHITDEKYDPKSIDLPGLQLLGARQMKFLQIGPRTGRASATRRFCPPRPSAAPCTCTAAKTTVCSPTSTATAGLRRPATRPCAPSGEFGRCISAATSIWPSRSSTASTPSATGRMRSRVRPS